MLLGIASCRGVVIEVPSVRIADNCASQTVGGLDVLELIWLDMTFKQLAALVSNAVMVKVVLLEEPAPPPPPSLPDDKET